MQSRLALTSRRVITPEGMRPAVVVIDGERIAAVLKPGEPCPVPREEVRDLGDLVLMSGLVDAHVHVNQPGRTEWEGFATATRAAAAGGVTTVIDMPLNCIPVTTTRSALDIKLEDCAPHLSVDCAFWGGVIPGNAGELPDLCRGGIYGAKAFLCHSGIDDFPKSSAADLRAAMPKLAAAGVPLLVHAELEGAGGAAGGDPRSYRTYLGSRPAAWEDAAIRMMVDLCRDTGCPVHVVHLSSGSAIEILADARAEGLPISVETCPHYLCLSAEDVPDGATEFKCAPPIREAANRERLWAGLRDGVIDFVTSDHSPCVPSLKVPETGDFLEAWGGIASLELGLRNVWTAAQARGFRVEDVARWMSAGPAAFAGLDRKGAVAAGRDADLVAWDPDAPFVIEASQLHHRHPVTPYRGRRGKGRVVTTWLRGAVIHDDGDFAAPRGQPILRGA